MIDMMGLLYINTVVFAFTGVMFALLGTNVQSRLFGLVGLGCTLANGLFAAGVLK